MPTPSPAIHAEQVVETTHAAFTCPHCGLAQSNKAHSENFGGFVVRIRQCMVCESLTIDGIIREKFPNGANKHLHQLGIFYPKSANRISKVFMYVPDEIVRAYEDACLLRPIHAGASGAYVRRALELILEKLGYGSKQLSQSIDAAVADKDPDRRLRRSLLTRLEYVREIGNFALHIRRDDEMVLIEISDEEVDACLETIEELLEVSFEEPGADRAKIIALNEKLSAAGKKLMTVPHIPT